MPGDGSGVPSDGTFSGLFGVFIVIFVLAIAFAIVRAVMNTKKMVDAGQNPLTLQTDIELAALKSQALAPAATTVTASSATVEQKLAQLDDLHARKIITDEELAASRLKVLGE